MTSPIRLALLASLLLATPAMAQSTPTSSGNTPSGGNLPTSGTQNGMGTPTGTGLGTDGNSTLVAPGGGGNGFQNNTSLNGSSSTGTPAGVSGTTP